jgi:hypothetical protein
LIPIAIAEMLPEAGIFLQRKGKYYFSLNKFSFLIQAVLRSNKNRSMTNKSIASPINH